MKSGDITQIFTDVKQQLLDQWKTAHFKDDSKINGKDQIDKSTICSHEMQIENGAIGGAPYATCITCGTKMCMKGAFPLEMYWRCHKCSIDLC